MFKNPQESYFKYYRAGDNLQWWVLNHISKQWIPLHPGFNPDVKTLGKVSEKEVFIEIL